MATSIPIDEIDDRIVALEALAETIRQRVTVLEQVIVPSPPGTVVILPIIGYTIVYTVPL